jgi:hypothetical protein
MTNAQIAAISFLSSQADREAADRAELAKLQAENEALRAKRIANRKPAKAKATGAVRAPVNGATVYGLAMPDKGTLDAAGFMRAMADAGKRTVHMVRETVNGKVVCHPVPQATDTSYTVSRVEADKVRDDSIQAIAAYIGYDNRRNFGEQEQAARMTAQRALLGPVNGPDREAQRAADNSAAGFVAGLPAPVQAKLADLRGREKVAAEEMCKHEEESKNPLVSDADRELSRGLMLVEQERIESIRRDIRALTFR